MSYQSKYVKTKPVTITKERFMEMLCVMPPSRWYRGDHIEWFHVCEHLSGDLVMWFIRAGDYYWEFNDSCLIDKGELAAIVAEAIMKKEAPL